MWFRKKREIDELKKEIQDKDLIINQQKEIIGIDKTLEQEKRAEINKRYYLKHKKENQKRERDFKQSSFNKEVCLTPINNSLNMVRGIRV